MFITNHVLSGALLGLAAPRRPVAVAVVAVGSHFALDSVPHWGTADRAKFRRVAIVDGLIGLGTMAAVLRVVPRSTRVAVLAGMLGASFPDSDKPSEMFFGWSPFPASVDHIHARIQRESAQGLRVELRAAAAMWAGVRLISAGRSFAQRLAYRSETESM